MIELRKCTLCKNKKELDNFYKYTRNKKLRFSSHCKECQKNNKKIHYQNNKENYRINTFNNSKWFIDLKMKLKCIRCGFSHPAALDFHHLDPKEKKFNVNLGKATGSKENKTKILEEIEKCIVLCSNCHRIEHSTIINEYINNKVL